MPSIEKGESESDYVKRCIPYCINKEGLSPDAAAAKCHGMYKEHKEKGTQYEEPNKKIEMYVPPESGDAPESVKSILQAAYGSCRSEWVKDHPNDKENEANKTSCSKQSWAAVHNAGWNKDKDGNWKKSEHESEFQIYNFECSLEEFSANIPLKSNEVETDKQIIENEKWIKLRAVAVIGDRMMKNRFVPYDELKKTVLEWNKTYHDINHMGTSYPDTNFPFKRQNIEYIIGYQKNAESNDKTKVVSMDVIVNKQSPKYTAWKSFVDINKESGMIPNVSMSVVARAKRVKAKDLNFDAKSYGFDDNDVIECLYDIHPKALTTCLEGDCNSEKGCGIATKYEKETCNCKDNDCKDDKTNSVAVSDEDAKYLLSLVEKTKKLKDEKYLAEMKEKINKQNGGK
jgi:cation transport regulator ChaB